MGSAAGEEHPGHGRGTLSWVDPRAAAAEANDFLLELFGDPAGDDTPTSAGDKRPASTAATQVAMNKGRGVDATGTNGALLAGPNGNGLSMDIADPGPGEPQASEGQSQRRAAPLSAGDDQHGAHSEQAVIADPGSALSQSVVLGSVLPLSAPPSVLGAPVSLPRASRPAWPYLDTSNDGSDGRGSRAWVKEGAPGGMDTGPSWDATDPLEGLELLLDLDDLGPSSSAGADAAGPIGAASGDAGPATRRREPRWDAWLGPAARRAKLGELTTKLLGMARTRGFVTLHDLARAAAWLRHDTALLDELCARLDAEGVCATESVAHTSLLGASLEGIAARFASLLARTPDERAILRNLGYGPRLIAELSAESRAFAVRAFTLHQLTRAQEVELVRVVIAARAGPAGVGDGAAVERAKLALFHDNLWIAVRLAPRYRGRGVPLDDLIQEGCLGILKAIDRYEYGGHPRFMGYAALWIMQRMRRAIGDTGRTVRLPIHLQDQLRGMAAAERSLSMALGRAPTLHELAARLEVTPERVRDLALWRRPALSLDVPNAGMAEALERTPARGDSAVHNANVAARLEGIEAALAELTPRMRRVLDLRLGLSSGGPATLEEIGQMMGVTRERIRQIEKKTLDRLREAVGRYLSKQAALEGEGPAPRNAQQPASATGTGVKGQIASKRGPVANPGAAASSGSNTTGEHDPARGTGNAAIPAKAEAAPTADPAAPRWRVWSAEERAEMARASRQAVPATPVLRSRHADLLSPRASGAPCAAPANRERPLDPSHPAPIQPRSVDPSFPQVAAAATSAGAPSQPRAATLPTPAPADPTANIAVTVAPIQAQPLGNPPSQTASPAPVVTAESVTPAITFAVGMETVSVGEPTRHASAESVGGADRRAGSAPMPAPAVEAALPAPGVPAEASAAPAAREEVFPLCPALLQRRPGATLLDELLFVRGLLGTHPTTQQFVEALLRWPQLLLPKDASRALTARGALDCYYVLGLINPTRLDAPSLVSAGRWSMDLAEVQRRCFESLRRRVAYMDATVALLTKGTPVRVPDLAGVLYRTEAAKGWQIEETQRRLDLLAGLGLVTRCDEAYQARPTLIRLVAQPATTPSVPLLSPTPVTVPIPSVVTLPTREAAASDSEGEGVGPQNDRALREGVVNWALLGAVPQAAAPLLQPARVALFTLDDPYAGLELLDDLSDYCISRAEPKQGSTGFDIAG